VRDKHTHNLKFNMRGKIFDEDTMIDIRDFEIINEKENKFISDCDNMELCIDDFQYLIIYGDVFKNIVKSLCEKSYNQGIQDAKKPKVQKEEPKMIENTEQE